MSGVSFRYATPEDAGLVMDFVRQLSRYEKAEQQVEATEDMIREELGKEHGAKALLVEAEGTEVGCAVFFRNYSVYLGRPGIFLDALIISEQYRGKGYGKALFERLRQETIHMGGARMEWLCLDWNEPSMEFYKNRGGRRLDICTTYRLPVTEKESEQE